MKPQHDNSREGENGASAVRCLVIGPYLQNRREPAESAQARLAEAAGLARAIDLKVEGEFIAPLSEPRPATYLGAGKVEEFRALVEERDIGLVVMDCALSPGQQRNLERALKTKVIDRTGLILEIFGQRARTREGALQVELAHLTYQKSRLVRSWTHLERQRGGFGFLGGPGETQIETDRRLILERMSRIRRDLEQVKRTRALHRKSRRDAPFPLVALVGYTNAGKSTLFNHLTRSDVLAKDMLFATLDPTLRAVKLPHGAKIILSDTVGFISDLPTMLVSAFRATLEEVLEAEIILHVRDISHPETEAQREDVAAILRELGIEAEDRDKVLEVWNKADLLSPERHEGLGQSAQAAHDPQRRAMLVSAVTGEGLDDLLSAIERRLGAGRFLAAVDLPGSDGEGLAWAYRNAEVLSRKDQADGDVSLVLRLPGDRLEKLLHLYPHARRIDAGDFEAAEAMDGL